MAVYRLGEHTPDLHPSAWVAETAMVVGRIVLEADASVWYGAVLRGDNETIRVGRGSNVQDGSVLHTDMGYPLSIGEGVIVGHQAMLHGCTIGDGSLVGIGAVVLNGATIGARCMIGAGALIPAGKTFPDGVLIVGAPAKVVRELRPEEVENLKRNAGAYVEQARRHRDERVRIDG